VSLGSDYEDAVRSGNTQLANYLAQALAANAGININTNQVTAAPASMLPQTPMYSSASSSLNIPKGFLDPGQPDASNPNALTWSNALGALAQGFTNPFDTFFGNQDEQRAGAASKAATAAGVGDTVASVGSLLKIVTDVPRMVTIFIGLILLIAGLFMLGNKTIVAAVEATRA